VFSRFNAELDFFKGVIMMFDVVVLDLDGTLLKNDKTVSSETLRTLKEFEDIGKQIVVATARPPRLGEIKLPEELQKEFMIFYNGAEIYHNKKIIYNKCIPVDSAKKFMEFLMSTNNQCRVGLEINNKLHANFDVKQIFNNVEFNKISLDSFETVPITKILIDMTSIEDIKILENNIPSECCMVITDNGRLAQIMAHGVNKLNALNYILQNLKTTIDKVIFFGDDINDLELIKECGIGVAMGNAAPIVKESADYVTKSNEEDGIAVFLNELRNIKN